ncbi:condensation domain-containing protein [Micromonospora okii]|uniref:condensation domain-containing protein n=1 Tax=Micromonospora okii TaxID=1182970 RepID=UPI001E57DCB1|nr:condensation domain-containing protein [Micromonospora okii]
MDDLDDRIARLSPAKRELLAQWLREGEPEHAPYVEPSNAVERSLVDIWGEVLEVDLLGIDDDYFELGGDSIHAIVIVARAQQVGLALGTQDIFDGRTVRTVAARIAPPSVATAPELPAPAEADPVGFPLTPLQEGILYHCLAGDTDGAYVVQLHCRLVGDLDLAAFAAAWRAVFAAHPALRAVVRWQDDGRPRQVLLPDATMSVETVDHRKLDETERQAAFARLLDEDRRRGFELRKGPLMRLLFVIEGPANHRCVWTYHHLVLDGWSQQLVLGEVFDRYTDPAGFVATADRPSFADFLTRSAAYRAVDEEFLRERLAGLDGGTRIAEAGAQSPVAVPRGRVDLVVPTELTAQLGAFARSRGLTLATLVHAVWALLLGLRTGRDDVVFGSTLSGRPVWLGEATRCVGMFVNTLPLRVLVTPAAVVSSWLVAIQRELAALADHQHAALSRIERTAATGSGAPLFDSILVVENYPTWIGEGDRVAGLRIDELVVSVDEGYPVVVEFTPGTPAALRARFDPRRVDRSVVMALMSAMVTCLRMLPGHVDAEVATLRQRVGRSLAEQLTELRAEAREAAGRRLPTARRRPTPVPRTDRAAGA